MSGLKHGTHSMYDKAKCRCEPCREAHRAHVARGRAERTVFNHGTRSAYDAGCRCADCKRARHEAHLREYTAKTGRRRAS